MSVFDQAWYSNLNLRHLGCKWVRSIHDHQKYHLEYPTMKGLGAVWAAAGCRRQWSGTDGRDATSLAMAKANVENEVRLALRSELERLDEALREGPSQNIVVISALAVKALQFGLGDAIVRAVISVANACSDSETLSSGQYVPKAAMVGVSVGTKVLTFARPVLPHDLCQRLGLEIPERARNTHGIAVPLKENVAVHSLKDLAEKCEQAVYEAVRQLDESLQS